MQVSRYGESAGSSPRYWYACRGLCRVWALSGRVFGTGSGTFVGLAVVAWPLFRRMERIELKSVFDRRGERRAGEQAKDVLFIMRLAFLVALGSGGCGHAERFQ